LITLFALFTFFTLYLIIHPMKNLKQIAVAVLVSGLSLSAVHAEPNQMDDILSDYGRGFGPESFGVAKERSFTKIYGSVDMALNYLKTADQSIIRLQSGNVWTSKLGFYSQEYLGDGTTALIRLENGFMANNGAFQQSNSLFNRASYIGLASPYYGKLTLGRQYGALGGPSLMMDPFLANSHESPETFLAYIVSDLGYANADAMSRTNSTLAYASPTFAKYFNIYASQAFNSGQSAGNQTHARSIAAGYSDAGNLISIGYSQGWCDPGTPGSCKDAVIAPEIRTDIFLTSWTHDFGPLLGSVGYLQITSQYAADPIARFYILGLQKKIGVNLLKVGLAYRDTTVANNHAWASSVGVDHFLSINTALYARASYLKNGAASALTYNYDASAGGIASVPAGSAVSSLSLGIYHHF
jgi:GBP family porin